MSERKDIREKIVEPHVQQSKHGTYILEANDVYNCMDEYFERRSMELLEWMSVNDVDCAGYLENKKSGKKFWYKGEWITAEELFKNFL